MVHECELSTAGAVSYDDERGKGNLLEFVGFWVGTGGQVCHQVLRGAGVMASEGTNEIVSFPGTLQGSVTSGPKRTGDRIPACKMTGDHCAALNS